MKPLFARLAIAAGAVSALSMALIALPVWAQQLETVPSVDLKRYVGRWYEIAKFPNSFQKQCVGNTTADYRVMADNTIEVVNRCKTAGGTVDLAIGAARVLDRSGNAKLEVRFAPAWLGWIPMVWGDYWIIDLDPNYTVATVGTPDRDYLWILSRTPTISDAEYENRVNNATKQGFDTSKLVKTRQ
jgi:apolipoprotein D and lipocalin family protein